LIYIVFGHITLQKHFRKEVLEVVAWTVRQDKDVTDESKLKDHFENANSVVKERLNSRGVKSMIKDIRYQHYGVEYFRGEK